MHSKLSRSARGWAVAAGALLLCAAPGLIRAQGVAATPAQAQKAARPAAPPKKPAEPSDDFADLKLTQDQQARIDTIREDGKPRMDAVIKDDKLGADQKQAMLQGIERMERNQVYRVLTAEQQREVRRRVAARRAAAQSAPGKERQSSPQ